MTKGKRFIRLHYHYVPREREREKGQKKGRDGRRDFKPCPPPLTYVPVVCADNWRQTLTMSEACKEKQSPEERVLFYNTTSTPR